MAHGNLSRSVREKTFSIGQATCDDNTVVMQFVQEHHRTAQRTRLHHATVMRGSM